MQVWGHIKNEKTLLHQRFLFFYGTLFIQDFMHVSTKLVPATFTLIFVLAAFVTMLHKILHIFIVLKSNFFAMISNRSDSELPTTY